MKTTSDTLRFDDLGPHSLQTLKKILKQYIGDPVADLDPAKLSDASVSHMLAAKVGQTRILQEVEAALRRVTPT